VLFQLIYLISVCRKKLRMCDCYCYVVLSHCSGSEINMYVVEWNQSSGNDDLTVYLTFFQNETSGVI